MLNKKWFTLAELIVSIAITWILILWVTQSILYISENLNNNKNELNIFSDINEFIMDSYKFDYNSWIIISNSWIYQSLLIYDNNFNWVLVWVFSSTGGYNYYLSDNNYVWNNYYGYFKTIPQTTTWIINNNSTVKNLNFNNWKTYQNLWVYDFTIKNTNLTNIYELNIDFLKNLPPNNTLKQNINKSNSENILKITVNL